MIHRSHLVFGCCLMAVTMVMAFWLSPKVDGRTEVAAASLLVLALGVGIGLVVAPILVAFFSPKVGGWATATPP